MTAEVVVCSRCGRDRSTESPLDAVAWVSETEGGHTTWLCPACAREHVRDIEGKLPHEYW